MSEQNVVVFYNVVFNVNPDFSITLDKSCKHCKSRFIVKAREPNLQETLDIISDLNNCIEICERINKYFVLNKNLEHFNEVFPQYSISDEEIDIIYNSIKSNTNNIFCFKDLSFLKRLIITKKESIERYEKLTNNKHIVQQ